jgi:Opioid growth factor receptor (OGFr) conserved region
MSALVAFHAGTGTDDKGRTRNQILAFDDRALEEVHDYIQWLFPLPEPSRFNPDAPLLTRDDVLLFRRQPKLRASVAAALKRMLAFYGFVRDEDGDVVPAPDFGDRAAHWLQPQNHNHLRLTRILRCLVLLGLPDEALTLYDCLEAIAEDAPELVAPQTLKHWHAAVQPLLAAG